jgi:hypothetical protein
MPTLQALDELRREAVPMKSCGRGEAGYSSADDQDCLDLCHGLPPIAANRIDSVPRLKEPSRIGTAVLDRTEQ